MSQAAEIVAAEKAILRLTRTHTHTRVDRRFFYAMHCTLFSRGALPRSHSGWTVAFNTASTINVANSLFEVNQHHQTAGEHTPTVCRSERMEKSAESTTTRVLAESTGKLCAREELSRGMTPQTLEKS